MKAFEVLSKGKESEGFYACEKIAREVADSFYMGTVVEVKINPSEEHLIDTRLHPSLWPDGLY